MTAFGTGTARVATGAAGLAAAASAGVLLATSDRLANPVEYGALTAEVAASAVLIGLYWSWRRPASRFSLLLVGFGFLVAAYALQGVDGAVPYAVGVLIDGPAFLLTFYLVFAFPTGRIARRVELAVFAACVALVVAAFVPWLLVSKQITGRGVVADCKGACPTNGLLVADWPGLSKTFGHLVDGGRFAVSVAIVLALLHRLVRSTPPQRRAFVPVFVPTLVFTVAFGLFGLLAWNHSPAPELKEHARWVLVPARGLLAFGFLAALVQSQTFAARALETMVEGLRGRRGIGALRDVVARSLDDPSLELAFWLPRAREFTSLDGQRLLPQTLGSDRVWTPIEENGRPVAAVIHDAALREDPELLEAAGSAILLALDNKRLEADLQRSIDDLRASRARLVSAGDAERRRLERNLHDSAQQQLAALRMRVDLTRRYIDDPETLDERLVQIGEELDAALAEVRTISQGIYPPLLEAEGLAPALRQAARRVERPVSVSDERTHRYPQDVETAVYFCCLEALQNAVKHGGEEVSIRIELHEDDGCLRFEVADDGVGFDRSRARGRGSGLDNMNDRIWAVGGSVDVVSAPNGGTTVSGQVPVAGPAAPDPLDSEDDLTA